MHDTAYETARAFFHTYWQGDYRRFLDLSALNHGGSLRDLCPADAEYVGAGVDAVFDDQAKLPFEDHSFDVIAASSCFEHYPLFWITFLELGRILKPGGLIYINSPSNGPLHAFPLDCWRFYPHSASALTHWAHKNDLDIDLVESFTCGRKADVWNDCVMIFAKGQVEARHLYRYLSVPVWNICQRDGLHALTVETEDMKLLDQHRQVGLGSTSILTRAVVANMALARAPADNHLTCAVCGQAQFGLRTQILDRELVEDWELTPAEAIYIGRQQGTFCALCGANLRSQVLARAITSYCGKIGPLMAAVQHTQQAPMEGKVLEINEAGHLSSVLSRFPNYTFGAYPDIDLLSLPYEDASFDLIVHSDTLEHIPDPIAALAECYRVLKSGGACIFTVPIVVDRLSRDRTGLSKSYHGTYQDKAEDLLVHTEFGSDAWTYAARAGFPRVTMDSLDYPTAIAITAWKGVRQTTPAHEN